MSPLAPGRLVITGTVTDLVTGLSASGTVTYTVLSPPAAGKLGAYPASGNAAPGPFESQIGPIAICSRYEVLGFTVSAADAALAAGGQTLAYCVATRTLGTWAQVAAGALDADIIATAKSIGALGVLVYVGYDNEWDGHVRQAQGGAMSAFAAAFEHVSAIFRTYAPLAKICVVPTGNNLTPAVAAAFPSLASYDYVCFDPYDEYLSYGSPLAALVAPFEWLASNKLAVGKRLGIFETGVSQTEPDASEAAWNLTDGVSG